jgi:hypothetical protein
VKRAAASLTAMLVVLAIAQLIALPMQGDIIRRPPPFTGGVFTQQTTFKNTAAMDAPADSGELLSAANWTLGAGWSGTWAGGFTHANGGGTATLTNTLAATNGAKHLITITVTGRTAGTYAFSFGGYTSGANSASTTLAPQASNSNSLVITPSNDFDGTITLSIRRLTAVAGHAVELQRSDGSTVGYIRASLDQNVFMGENVGGWAVPGIPGAGGAQNVGVGYSVLENVTTGSANVALGYQALRACTLCTTSIAIGPRVLEAATTAQGNVALGNQSMLSVTSGSVNVGIGPQTLQSNTTGGNNVAIGNAALLTVNASQNVAVGVNSLTNVSTGASNTAIGHLSGRYVGSGTTSLQTNTFNTLVGMDVRSGANGNTNETVIGANAIGNGSNTVTLGDDGVTTVYMSEDSGATVRAAGALLGATGATWRAPGVIYAHQTTVGNPASTTETDAWSYSLPASTLATDGDALVIEADMALAANANNKSARIYFGAVAIPFNYVAGAGSGQRINFRARIVRTSATTQRISFDRAMGSTGGGTVTPFGGYTTGAETLTGAITIRGSVQSPTTGAANDVVSNLASITFYPAP